MVNFNSSCVTDKTFFHPSYEIGDEDVSKRAIKKKIAEVVHFISTKPPLVKETNFTKLPDDVNKIILSFLIDPMDFLTFSRITPKTFNLALNVPRSYDKLDKGKKLRFNKKSLQISYDFFERFIASYAGMKIIDFAKFKPSNKTMFLHYILEETPIKVSLMNPIGLRFLPKFEVSDKLEYNRIDTNNNARRYVQNVELKLKEKHILIKEESRVIRAISYSEISFEKELEYWPELLEQLKLQADEFHSKCKFIVEDEEEFENVVKRLETGLK